ncbi:hypothetical protein CAPTEDRAFT_198511, partial [Capitella teleta]
CSHVNVQKFINELLHGVFKGNEYLAGRSTTGKEKAKAGLKARPGLNKQDLINIIKITQIHFPGPNTTEKCVKDAIRAKLTNAQKVIKAQQAAAQAAEAAQSDLAD